MHRLAATIILSSVAFAQNAEDAAIASAAKSPITLARYIDSHSRAFDWRALWSALGIGGPKVSYPLCGDRSFDRIYSCSTEAVRVTNPEQIILIVKSSGVRTYDIYLRYLKEKGSGWRFAGERSAALYDNYPRRHEIIRIGDKPFLKISSDLSQVGGGWSQEVEDWFDLAQRDFEPAFSFTARGGFCCFGAVVGREIKAQVTPGLASGLETIELKLSASFVAFTGELASGDYRGIYERSPAEVRFTLRRAYSGSGHSTAMPTKEFEELADLRRLTEEQSLAYALPGLRKIATGADPEAKEWLRLVLDRTRDTPSKRSLLELLAKP